MLLTNVITGRLRHFRHQRPSLQLLARRIRSIAIRARERRAPVAWHIGVVPVPLQRVHATEALVASPNHDLPLEYPLSALRVDPIRVRVAHGHPATHPLRLHLVAEMREDVPLHVRGALVPLDVVAPPTPPRIGPSLRPSLAAARRALVEHLSVARSRATVGDAGAAGRGAGGCARGRRRGARGGWVGRGGKAVVIAGCARCAAAARFLGLAAGRDGVDVVVLGVCVALEEEVRVGLL